MEACLKDSETPFLTRQLNTLQGATRVRVRGTGGSFVAGGGVN